MFEAFDLPVMFWVQSGLLLAMSAGLAIAGAAVRRRLERRKYRAWYNGSDEAKGR